MKYKFCGIRKNVSVNMTSHLPQIGVPNLTPVATPLENSK